MTRHSLHLLRAAVVTAACVLGLAACGSSGGGSTSLVTASCDPGTQVQLASPLPNQTGVSTTIGQVVIVAYGSNGALNTNPGSWSLTLVSSFGSPVISSGLSPFSYPSGPHPYPSDFYYAATIPALSPATSYNVYLGQGSSCTPIPVGSFST
ncbi:MAG TPA: hypothetical protein VNJ51_02530 [Candidatus Dormibacteraeota bacterium]|nr:hypothetical protein [Candidatus Dormibacteraeota bacterium]